jgi:hypothetical protein
MEGTFPDRPEWILDFTSTIARVADRTRRRRHGGESVLELR